MVSPYQSDSIELETIYWVAVMLYGMIMLLLLSSDATVVLVSYYLYLFFRAAEKTH